MDTIEDFCDTQFANHAQLKYAYKRLVLKLHPDKSGRDSGAEFRKCKEVYALGSSKFKDGADYYCFNESTPQELMVTKLSFESFDAINPEDFQIILECASRCAHETVNISLDKLLLLPFAHPKFALFDFWAHVWGQVGENRGTSRMTLEQLEERYNSFCAIFRHFTRWRFFGLATKVTLRDWHTYNSNYVYKDNLDLDQMPGGHERDRNLKRVLYTDLMDRSAWSGVSHYLNQTDPEIIHNLYKNIPPRPPPTKAEIKVMLEPVFAAIRARHADERSPDETSNILLRELQQDIVQTEARSRKRQRTEPADADESPDTHPSAPDLAAAFAQYRQRCAEAREAYAAAMKQNRQLEKAREMLERTLAVVREETKTAVARAEESEKLLTKVKAEAEEARRRVEELDSATMEKERGGAGGGSNAALQMRSDETEVKIATEETAVAIPVVIDSNMSVRRQIDASQAVMQHLLGVFVGCRIKNGWFKITDVGRRLCELEGDAAAPKVTRAGRYIRTHLPSNTQHIPTENVIKFAGFDDIVTAICGAPSYPRFRGLLASLRKMGIAPDMIAAAAFAQQSRLMKNVDTDVIAAIRGHAGVDWKPEKSLCIYILRDKKNCPVKAKHGQSYCSRHTPKQ